MLSVQGHCGRNRHPRGRLCERPRRSGRGDEPRSYHRHLAAPGDRRELRHADRRRRRAGADPRAGGRDLHRALLYPALHRRPAQALQPSVFDMYVNAGANAVKILQRLLTPVRAIPATPTARSGRRPSWWRRWRRTLVAPGRCLWHRPAQLLLRPGRCAPLQPQVRAPARRWQGRLDPARRGLPVAALPPDGGAAPRPGGGMGVIDKMIGGPGAVTALGQAAKGWPRCCCPRPPGGWSCRPRRRWPRRAEVARNTSIRCSAGSTGW